VNIHPRRLAFFRERQRAEQRAWQHYSRGDEDDQRLAAGIDLGQLHRSAVVPLTFYTASDTAHRAMYGTEPTVTFPTTTSLLAFRRAPTCRFGGGGLYFTAQSSNW
jgi:hypothetical protein